MSEATSAVGIQILGVLLGLALGGYLALAGYRAGARDITTAPDPEPAYPYRRTVFVNLKSGRAFRGVLWERTGGWLILKNAEALPDRSAPVPVDGDTLLPYADVEFMQITGAVDGADAG